MAGEPGERLGEEARASYEAGDFQASRQSALAALVDRPDDPDLLRVAGKSSLELNLDDAVGYLERAVALDADDADAWHELGDALVSEGRLEEACDAFRRTVELRPGDVRALVDLGHASFAAGRSDDAVRYLEQAVETEPASADGLRGLVDVHRREGRREEALTAARRLAEQQPDDVVAALDVGELCLELGRFDEAAEAFGRVRSLDDDADHEVYAYHGTIEAEIRREHWRSALDLAVDATRLDRLGRTTDVLAFIVAQVFGESDRPSPSRAQIEEALAMSRAEHRRLHLEILAA